MTMTKYAGGDLAQIGDSSALAIVGLEDGIIRLLEMIELRPKKGAPLKLSEIIATFAETLARHELGAFMADGHVREAAREHADKRGLAILDAPEGRKGKMDVYLATRDAIREGQLRLGVNLRLRAQLMAITSRPVPGGGLSISSPRRAGHGDLVSALTLAVWQARTAHQSTVRYDDRFDAFVPRMSVNGGGVVEDNDVLYRGRF